MTDVMGALAEARALGFLGPGPLEAHVASAESFAAAIGIVNGFVLDMGSGGGVPGLLLASAHPDLRMVLLDNNRRRTSFLARVVAELGWAERVEVVRAAAEEAAHDPRWRRNFDVVLARSFGPPPLTAECAAGFLRLGGRLVVGEPPNPTPGRWPVDGLSLLGFEVTATGAVQVLTQRADPLATMPRPWKRMERQPLWETPNRST